MERAGSGSRIVMRFDYRMRYGLLGALLGRTLVARKFGPIAKQLLENWADAIAERARAESVHG